MFGLPLPRRVPRAKALACSLIMTLASLVAVPAQESPPTVSIDAIRRPDVTGPAAPSPAGPRKADIQVRDYGVVRSGWALPVDPGETVEFTFLSPGADKSWSGPLASDQAVQRVETVEVDLPGASLSFSAGGAYRLIAPQRAGNYPLRFTVSHSVRQAGRPPLAGPTETFEAMLLVKAPFNRAGNGMIGDYPIGIYPNEEGRNVSSFVERYRELYKPPASFILSTPEVEPLHVSEHFTLGEFVPSMERGRRCYLALDPRLLTFLEAALVELNPTMGRPERSKPIVVLNAFLSPNHLMQFDARGIEITLFSRAQYGDAAAVIWDADGDGIMDDLNGDGVIDYADAQLLADRLAEVQRKLGKFGGIGAQAAPQLPHLPKTPYVDVDMRGVSSRW